MPAELRGLYGDPVGVATTGGFIGWHYGAYFALIAGLWSILGFAATIVTILVAWLSFERSAASRREDLIKAAGKKEAEDPNDPNSGAVV